MLGVSNLHLYGGFGIRLKRVGFQTGGFDKRFGFSTVANLYFYYFIIHFILFVS